MDITFPLDEKKKVELIGGDFMDFAYVFVFLTVIVPILYLLFSKIRNKVLNKEKIVEIFLMSFLVIFVGIGSIWAFIGHAFLSAQVATSIGWAPGSPFQIEQAFGNLAIGVIGVLCYWIRGNFWTATVISSSIYLLGDAYVHIANMLQFANYAPGNAGSVLYVDIIGPLIVIVLFIVNKSMEEGHN